MHSESPMQVTVTFLPVSLSLVRIPRSRLSKLSHPLLRQILKPNPTFLNITCNELELSVFAESDVLEDFEAIAKRDRQKKISRSRPRSRKASCANADDSEYDFVEISYDTWNVLQIDSHSDGLDNSGARVHELSAPLAAAGISILYLSSYMSDFLFVKASRLQKVVSLMATAGFDLYSSDPTQLTSQMSPLISPLISPVSHDDSSSVVDLCPEINSATVITRSRSSTGSSLTSALLKASAAEPSDSSEEEPLAVRSQSHSPSASQVLVLSPDLTCVGLSDEHADLWALKIIKLVAFPELIPPASRKNSTSSSSGPHSPAFEFDATPNGILTPSDSSSDEEEELDTPPNENPTSLPSRTLPDLSMTNIKTVSNKIQTQSCRRNSESRSREPVPFYSFTRTSEGSSLTTDVNLLAALFPSSERHMVICSDELETADNEDSLEEEIPEDSCIEPSGLSGTFKCLQIDLRKFGLDKHGLINRYSRVLQENGINHMYSSTFKTANLLVSKSHALRAHDLLRAC